MINYLQIEGAVPGTTTENTKTNMNVKFENGAKTVTVKNGIVIQSDTEFCPVGQKPNMDFLRRCGWKKERKPVIVYAHGGTNPTRFRV